MNIAEARALLAKPKRRKFGNKPTMVDAERFDSRGEARRYGELMALARAGQIQKLERQVLYKLVVNGFKVGSVRPDFRYVQGGKTVCEDYKGAPPPNGWVVRWKLAAALYPDVVWQIVGPAA